MEGEADQSCSTEKYNVFFVLENIVKLFRDFELHLLCTLCKVYSEIILLG